MDPGDPETRALLEASGFKYNQTVNCWIHKGEGRVISHETIEQHDLAWLAQWIAGG